MKQLTITLPTIYTVAIAQPGITLYNNGRRKLKARRQPYGDAVSSMLMNVHLLWIEWRLVFTS